MIERALRVYLLADAGLAAVIGSRLYLGQPPQRDATTGASGQAAALPMVVCERLTTDPLGDHLLGRSPTAIARIGFACRAARADTSRRVAEMIAARCGAVIDAEIGSGDDVARVKSIRFEDLQDDTQPPRAGEALGEYVTRLELRATYYDTETLPAS